MYTPSYHIYTFVHPIIHIYITIYTSKYTLNTPLTPPNIRLIYALNTPGAGAVPMGLIRMGPLSLPADPAGRAGRAGRFRVIY